MDFGIICKKSEGLTHPAGIPDLHTHSALPSIPPGVPQQRGKGYGSRLGGWEEGGGSDEMDMEGDGHVGETRRPPWARSLRPRFSRLSAASWHSTGSLEHGGCSLRLRAMILRVFIFLKMLCF